MNTGPVPHPFKEAMTDTRNELAPEMATAVAKRAEIEAGLPPLPQDPDMSLVRARMLKERQFWNEDAPPVERVMHATLPGPFRNIPVQVYYPDTDATLPAIVYFHGGGWVMGSPATHDRVARVLSRQSGAAVFSVDYVLAPEHRFPAPLEEGGAVVEALAGQAERWGIDGRRLALAGDSAGANVALATALDLLDARSVTIAALALLYGAYDTDFDTPSYSEFGAGEFGLPRSEMIAYWDHYLGAGNSVTDPRAAILRRASLAGLPPTYLCAAGLDVLRDDTLRLAQRFRSEGVPFELECFDGFCHGFAGLGRIAGIADKAVAAAAAYVTSAFER